MNHLAVVSLHADPATPSGAGEGGGTHAYVRELLAGLASCESRVTVLTRWANANLPAEEVPCSNIRIVRLAIGPVTPLDKRGLNDLHPVSLSRAQAVLADSPPEVIHSIYWNSGRVALDLGRLLRCPFVHTVISNGLRKRIEGSEDQDPDRIVIESRVFAEAFAIFCISGEEQEDLIELYGVAPEKTIIVGRPVAPAFRSPCRDELGQPNSPRYPL